MDNLFSDLLKIVGVNFDYCYFFLFSFSLFLLFSSFFFCFLVTFQMCNSQLLHLSDCQQQAFIFSSPQSHRQLGWDGQGKAQNFCSFSGLPRAPIWETVAMWAGLFFDWSLLVKRQVEIQMTWILASKWLPWLLSTLFTTSRETKTILLDSETEPLCLLDDTMVKWKGT